MVLCLGFAGCVQLLKVLPLTIPGDEGPRPNASMDRSFEAAATLDVGHPTAVQPFSLSVTGGLPDILDLTAYVRGGLPGVRTTILADDGGDLALSWPYGTGSVDVVATAHLGVRTGRYLALVELVDPRPNGETEVNLTIEASAAFTSPLDTTAPIATVPLGFDLNVQPSGAFALRTVASVRASYRETVRAAAGSTARTLRLRFEGAAKPASLGGSGHAVVTFRVDDYSTTRPDMDLYVLGRIPSLSIDFFEWTFPGSGRTDANLIRRIGGDPTPECRASDAACEASFALDLDLREGIVSYGTASAPPQTASLTFVVEVVDYLLDTTAVPAGAAVTATLESGPVPAASVG